MRKEIWEYYKKLAFRIGTDENGKTFGYSVSWFYDEKSTGIVEENLNNLTKAFLRDDNAKARVHCATESELQFMRKKVKELCGDKPYPAQIDAISNALLNELTIIQGPPGTGKTETIKNILFCIRQFYPEAKIAVISANSEALENAKDAVKEEESLKKSYARLGPMSKREAFKSNLEECDPNLWARLSVCNRKNHFTYPAFLLDYYPIIFSTIHSLRKCIADVEEYDYVIVDECSQVPCVIGMLAIASAKHLVLLGDDEQLPPIHKDLDGQEIEYTSMLRQEFAWCVDEGDNSFMKACKNSFGEKCRTILLNEHFRCHPAIIGFCNKYIYDNKLITRTKDDGKLPIRIRWYEGDYWERIEEIEKTRDGEPKKETTGKKKYQNYNKRQIEVFIFDELPEIIKTLHANRNYSICVLSPYRYQLELLQARLDEIIDKDESAIENVLEEENPEVNDIAQLTIHRAQGRGYDRVYIMPVQDTAGRPWSQKRELINVAVSRAKKEICVITSSVWLPEDLQKEYTGYYVPNEYKKECYIRDFLQYVYKAEEQRKVGENYGFVKTSLNSVFDKVPFYRWKLSYVDVDELDNDDEPPKEFAPEFCMYKVLKKLKILPGYSVYREIPLSAFNIQTSDGEVSQYIKNGARFDFVITKGNNVYAIIEVDGEYHRADQKQVYYDELKDRAVSMLSEEFALKRYIRIPTDGTTNDEIKMIVEAVESDCTTVTVNSDMIKDSISMIDYLNSMMEKSADLIADHIHDGEIDETLKKILISTDYKNPKGTDYHYDDTLYNAVYFMRYGYAYAYEYYVIYQTIIEKYPEKIFGVTSLGCGSCIDAWAMAYAQYKNLYERELRYVGSDMNVWGMQFKPEKGNEMERYFPYTETSRTMRYPGIENMQSDIVDFYANNTWQYSYNTLMFPKILNELPDDVLESLIHTIRENADQYKTDREYFICISHSPYDYNNNPKMKDIAKTIVDAINYDGRFDVDYTLPETWYNLSVNRGLEDVSEEGKEPCYRFELNRHEKYDSIAYMDFFFTPTEKVEEVRNVIDKFLKEEDYHMCVKSTSTSLFQIVRLTPKKKEEK